MEIKRKSVVYAVAFIITLGIAAFLSLWFVNAPYRSKIPALPNLQTLPNPLQEQIKDADKIAHNWPTSDNLGSLGMVYHSAAEYDKALDCYKLAIKKNKSKWIWEYYLGYLFSELGETENAVSCFSSVVKKDSRVWHAWYYLGDGFQKLGLFDQADMAFSKIPYIANTESSSARTDLFPLETYAKYQMARVYLNKREYVKTERVLKDIIKRNVSYGPAYRLMASIYSTRGDSSWSKYYIIRANDLTDYTPPVDTIIDRIAQISRSELYLLKQIDEAVKSYNIDWTISLLNNALINIPDNRYIVSKAVKLYLRFDNVQRALPLLTSHLKFYNNDFNELKEVADLLYSNKQYLKAIDYYEQMKKMKPGDAATIAGKALALADNGKKTEALTLMDKLVNDHKNDVQALKEAIYFSIVENEPVKAVAYLAILKTKAPADPKIFKYEGMIAEQDGNTPKAIALFETACQKDPSDVSTFQYLGDMLVHQNMWRRALDHYRNALKVHPNNSVFLGTLGSLLVSCPDKGLRNYAVGKEFSERAFFNVESSTETRISAGRSLGWAYRAMGDRNNSSTYINIALRLARNENYPREYIQELENMIQ